MFNAALMPFDRAAAVFSACAQSKEVDNALTFLAHC
jgi:hypothetical protein